MKNGREKKKEDTDMTGQEQQNEVFTGGACALK